MKYRRDVHTKLLKANFSASDKALTAIIKDMNEAYKKHFGKYVRVDFTQSYAVEIERACVSYLKSFEVQVFETESDIQLNIANAIAESNVAESVKIALGYILPYSPLDVDMDGVSKLLEDKKAEYQNANAFDANAALNDIAGAVVGSIQPGVDKWRSQLDLSFKIFDQKWGALKKYYADYTYGASTIEKLKKEYESCKSETQEAIQGFAVLAEIDRKDATTITSIVRILNERSTTIFRCVSMGSIVNKRIDNFFFGLVHGKKLTTNRLD